MTAHTPEQATLLWCPMARVAQSGDKDIQGSYNRTLTKSHRPITVARVKSTDDFELGDEPVEHEEVLALEMSVVVSHAARCIGDKCAMWRWAYAGTESGFCGLAGKPGVMP